MAEDGGYCAVKKGGGRRSCRCDITGYDKKLSSAFATRHAHFYIFLFGHFIVLLGVVLEVFRDAELFPVAPNQLFDWIAVLNRLFHRTDRVSISRAISTRQIIECHINKIRTSPRMEPANIEDFGK